MHLVRNIAAAMTSSIVVVLINLIALPFYLRYLGMEAYGLIGFYATLQTVLQVLDLGLAPTISREIAHGAEIGMQRRSASLLRTLGIVYLVIACFIAGIVGLVAPWIAEYWLQAKTLPLEVVTQAIALMGLNLACRWPISLYHGALVGSHRLARSSVSSIMINILAAATTLAVLAWGMRSILAFFLVQAGFGLLHMLLLRHFARLVVGERDAPYDFSDLRRIWRFSTWMSGIAITSLVFTQLDKALLSKLVDLESFGHYMLAALLVSGLQVVTGPTFNVIYPKFTTLLARNDQLAIAKFYSGTSRMYAAAIFALALALALHVELFVTLWTGRPDIAVRVVPLVGLLALGSALNGLMYFPYALQLASGKPIIPFLINVSLLVLAAPTVAWLALRYGVLGGALSWAMLGIAYVAVGTVATGRKVAKYAGVSWLMSDIAVPLLLALVPALAGAWLAIAIIASPLVESLIAISAACAGFAAGGLYSPFARRQVLAFFKVRGAPCPN